MSEELRTSRVKVFCPKCEDVYIPKKKCPDVDGCYFGCSFPSLLLMVIYLIYIYGGGVPIYRKYIHYFILYRLFQRFAYKRIFQNTCPESGVSEFIKRKGLECTKKINKIYRKSLIIQKIC